MVHPFSMALVPGISHDLAVYNYSTGFADFSMLTLAAINNGSTYNVTLGFGVQPLAGSKIDPSSITQGNWTFTMQLCRAGYQPPQSPASQTGSCTPCPIGYYAKKGQPSCTQCPVNFISNFERVSDYKTTHHPKSTSSGDCFTDPNKMLQFVLIFSAIGNVCC